MMVAEKAADLIRGNTPLARRPGSTSTVMLSELRVGEFLAALGERTPTPASGAATALTGALAAALTELAARFAGDDEAVIARQGADGAARGARGRGRGGLLGLHGGPERGDARTDHRGA